MADARRAMSSRGWVPWDRPAEVGLWIVALVLATIFIHNFTRLGKRHLPS